MFIVFLGALKVDKVVIFIEFYLMFFVFLRLENHIVALYCDYSSFIYTMKNSVSGLNPTYVFLGFPDCDPSYFHIVLVMELVSVIIILDIEIRFPHLIHLNLHSFLSPFSSLNPLPHHTRGISFVNLLLFVIFCHFFLLFLIQLLIWMLKLVLYIVVY